jgi:Na+-driven multidrug efflux pump
LYFASQGAGRMGWPLLAGTARVFVSVLGGFLALQLDAGMDGVFLALGVGLVVMGLINAGAVASGVWFRTAGVTAAETAPKTSAA